MPVPLLSDPIAAALRTDRTAALAAAFIIATRHADVLKFVVREIGDLELQSGPDGRDGAGKPRNGTGKRCNSGVDHRLAKRDEADEQLIEVMKASPGASIGDLAQAIERSRSTAVTALRRLRDAGLAESVNGVWRLIEEPRRGSRLKDGPRPYRHRNELTRTHEHRYADRVGRAALSANWRSGEMRLVWRAVEIRL